MDFSNIKALFYTTSTNECVNHIMAWDMLGTSEHIAFDYRGIRNDHLLLSGIEKYKPDVVFYIGAAGGNGLPKPETLRAARDLVPMINLCSDAADKPWHPLLELYKREDCFDLQVAIDGSFNSPCELSTLTPVNHNLFRGTAVKTIRAGFSGSRGVHCERSEIVNSLEWFAGLTVRKRSKEDGYFEHVKFLKSCQMVLNTSWNGTGTGHHMKGRVIETGMAGSCLLEHIDSPFAEWFPEDCCIRYKTARDVAKIIDGMSNEVISKTAENLHKHVMENYKSSDIYEDILGYVDLTKSRKTA